MALMRSQSRFTSKKMVLGLLGAALLIPAALFAPPAQAVPLPPALTGSNPASPGASLTPHILGQAEGVITSVVRQRSTARVARGPIAMSSAGSNPTVTIYANERNCMDSEAIAAEGTASELEHEGIEVTVAPDSVTVFYATLSKEGEFSTCSAQGFTYRQVTTPPAPPTLESVSPASPANENLPRLRGTAAAESIVSLYTTPDCSGSPVSTGSAAEFSAGGIQTPVPDNSTTTFHARASLGGIFSQCSETSVEYQEVTPPPPPPPPPPSSPPPPHQDQEPEIEGLSGPGGPPVPHLRTIPGVRSNDHTPLVTGTAPGAVTVRIYESAGCAGTPVAKGSAAQFAAGFPVAVSENAATSFYAVSVGSNEIRSACSAPISYFEDSILPLTRITMGPGSKTRKRSPVFRFADVSGDPAATSFKCRVNRGVWKPCSAPFHLRHLHFRSYVLFVKGVDALGNEERVGAKWHFKVVRHP